MRSSVHSSILLKKCFLLALLFSPLVANAQKFSRPEVYTCRIEAAYSNDSFQRKSKLLSSSDSDRFFSIELETGEITGNWFKNKNALFTKILNKNEPAWNYRVVSIVRSLYREGAITLHIEDNIPGKTEKGTPFSGTTLEHWISGYCQ